MTHFFIINPAAGDRDRTQYYKKEIREACRSRGLDFRIYVSAAPGDCERAAREIAREGKPVRIYACGGDGIVHRLQGLTQHLGDPVAAGAHGLMIEVHNDPKHALCDGAQSLTPQQFDDVASSVFAMKKALGE